MADECVLWCVAASVGGLDSTRRFDVHNSCVFKDLETDYPMCVFIVNWKKAECVHVRTHRILTVEPDARCTNVVLLSAHQSRDFFNFLQFITRTW